jgi:hypothetical protein
MSRREATRLVSLGQASQERAPNPVPPVSVRSYAAVESAGRLQSLAAQCAAHLQGVASPETTKLMCAWLDGYETALRTEIDALRQQIRMVAGEGQVAMANAPAPEPTHRAQVPPPPAGPGWVDRGGAP